VIVIKKFIFQIFVYICALVILLGVMLPYYWLVATSLQTYRELRSVPPNWVPKTIYLNRYELLLTGKGEVTTVLARGILQDVSQKFLICLRNSLVITVSTIFLSLILGLPGGYALARIQLPGRNFLLSLSLLPQLLFSVAIVVPLYMLMAKMRLMNTHLGIILGDTAWLLPFVIWIAFNFFRTIPRELEEAARVDGCTRLGALCKIILPISKPAIFSCSLFVFIRSWGEFLIALTLTRTYAVKTVPVLISEFSTTYGTDFGLMTTAGVIASLPPVLFALLFQKYLVQGLTAGAFKG